MRLTRYLQMCILGITVCIIIHWSVTTYVMSQPKSKLDLESDKTSDGVTLKKVTSGDVTLKTVTSDDVTLKKVSVTSEVYNPTEEETYDYMSKDISERNDNVSVVGKPTVTGQTDINNIFYQVNKSTKTEIVTKVQEENVHSNKPNYHKYSSTLMKSNVESKLLPKNHIAFLKVHKAASSTAQNIFLRYGFMRDLNFVLPVIPNKSYPNIISTTSTITSNNIIPPPINGSFDILCNHVIYNYRAFRRTLPPDTVFIGIVREPFHHFQSVLSYFRPRYILGIKSSYQVSEYLKNPWKYEEKRSPLISVTNNRMAVEYGFPLDLIRTKNAMGIISYLHKLDKEYLLVLIVEYFDESILLMKRLLNWTLKDILYLKRNVSRKRSKFYTQQSGDFENYQRWASVDYALYSFFYSRLWKQIKQQGSDFHDELLHFKQIRNRVEEFCLYGKSADIVISESPWNNQFSVDSFDCSLMLMPEIEFVNVIRKFQYPELNITTTDADLLVEKREYGSVVILVLMFYCLIFIFMFYLSRRVNR